MRGRLEQAALEGTLSGTLEPTVLAELVQTIWQGLSTRAELGASRDELMRAADLALRLFSTADHETVPPLPVPGNRQPEIDRLGELVVAHPERASHVTFSCTSR